MLGSWLFTPPGAAAATAQVSEWTEVVTVVLADVHEFVFLHEALRAVCGWQEGSDKDAAFHNNYGNAPRCFALTAWLGLG